MIKRLIIWIIGVWCFGMASAQSYHIGDVYIAPDGSKGVVYYLHPDGSGGWVVALNDVSTGCVWGDATDVPGLANQSSSEQLLLNDTAGFASTQLLRSYQNNNSYAAGVVDFAHGWVLPSPAQLSRLYARLPVISSALTSAGGTAPTTDLYWCSAEHSASNAWCVDFGSTSNYHLYSGQFYNTAKTTSCRVRAVRSFSYASESGLSYQWSTGATTSSITETPAQTTTYTVTVTAPDGSSGTAVQTVVVNSPVASTNSATACGSYTWNGVTYYESGDYTYAHTDANGCTQVDTLHLTLLNPLQVTVTVSDDTLCEGDAVTLDAVVLNADDFIAPSTPAVAVGDILCTDGTTVKPSEFSSSGKTAMGVVFYVDNTGEHGWAMHLQDQGTDVQWSPIGQYADIPMLTNYSEPRDAIMDLDGYSNTQNIRNAGPATQYPAAYAVDFANGWYLPALGQIRLIFSEMVTLNTSLQVVGGTQFPMNNYYYYWSSTEESSPFAWNVSHDGSMGSYGKGFNHRVRSIRNF